MTKVLANGALLVALIGGSITPALAQTSSTESFEDLARRAGSVLDSRPSEAAELYQRALAIRPDWAEGWMSLGGALYQLNRCAEATDAFRKGIKLAPGIGNAWAFLGLCEAELDDPDQALADIRKGEALGLHGNWQFEVAVRVRAAQLLMKASSFDEAPEQLLPLALRQEDSAVIEQTMGLAALGLGAAFPELPPEKRAVVALAGKAAWALASERPAEAAEAYEQLLARYPDEPGVHYAYGLYLTETNVVAAFAEFQKEAQNNPKHWPSLIMIGSLRIRQGEPEPAIQSLRQALKYVPAKHRWLCHVELGRAILMSGNLDVATTEFETAARLLPSNPQVHLFLAQVYRRAGRTEDARRQAAEFENLKAQQDPAGLPGLRPFASSAGK